VLHSEALLRRAVSSIRGRAQRARSYRRPTAAARAAAVISPPECAPSPGRGGKNKSPFSGWIVIRRARAPKGSSLRCDLRGAVAPPYSLLALHYDRGRCVTSTRRAAPTFTRFAVDNVRTVAYQSPAGRAMMEKQKRGEERILSPMVSVPNGLSGSTLG